MTSLWVHSIFFIQFPPKVNTHFVTTFTTPKGEVPITVSQSINRSAILVHMHDEIVAQPCTTYRKIFWPYIYLRQWEMLHPSEVGVRWLICCRDEYFIRSISTKRSGQWRCWYIIEVSFEMRNICNLVSCDFICFVCVLFFFLLVFCSTIFFPSFLL